MPGFAGSPASLVSLKFLPVPFGICLTISPWPRAGAGGACGGCLEPGDLAEGSGHQLNQTGFILFCFVFPCFLIAIVNLATT